MEGIYNVIVAQASIWAPSIAAVLSVVVGGLKLLQAISLSTSEAKKAIEEVKSDQTFKDLAKKIEATMLDNAELRRQNDVLIDELKRVKGYMEAHRRDQ